MENKFKVGDKVLIKNCKRITTIFEVFPYCPLRATCWYRERDGLGTLFYEYELELVS